MIQFKILLKQIQLNSKVTGKIINIDEKGLKIELDKENKYLVL